MNAANLALRFLLEISSLVAFSFWGGYAGATPLLGTTLAIATPLAAASLWGAFVSPKARVAVAWPVRITIELVIFGFAIAALAAMGEFKLTLILAGAVVFHQCWRAVELHRSGR